MKDKIFIDTNILIYFFSNDTAKASRVEKLFNEDKLEIVISTQVVSEFINVMIKKFNYSSTLIKEVLEDFKNNFIITSSSIETIILAVELIQKYSLSFWDSMITASALESNCQILYTEDMHHNLIVRDSLTIINLFKEGNKS